MFVIEFYILYLVLLVLIVIQSIAGVGILVIGTPFLLIFNYNMIDVLSILLPVSIITSLINLIFLKIKKRGKKFKIEKKRRFLFYTICVPSIFVGLLILRELKEVLNFKYIVSFVIFLSFIITRIKKFFWQKQNLTEGIFLFLTGIVHGLTNSGGSILSLFFSTNQDKEKSRYVITYFYFFIASVQYIVFLAIFENIDFFLNIGFMLIIIPLGCIIANFLDNFLSYKIFKFLVVILSLTSATFLISV